MLILSSELDMGKTLHFVCYNSKPIASCTHFEDVGRVTYFIMVRACETTVVRGYY
jgi:hypothetical protein